MIDNENVIYCLLNDIFAGKAYSEIALNEILRDIESASDRAYITRVFYGVIEKSVQFDFIISCLCPKRPKNNLITLIKIGIYLLRYTGTPDYAAIDKIVVLTKRIGKSGVSGFINAVLRKSMQINLGDMEFESNIERLSVLYSYPKWLVRQLIKEYGENETKAFLSYPKKDGTHIRHNGNMISKAEFELKLKQISEGIKNSGCGNFQCSVDDTKPVIKSELGYYVRHNMMQNIPPELFTAQSYASMIAVHSYLSKEEQISYGIENALDLCGAPGGKSIYLKELFQDLNITCCDIHPHRLKLIDDYARRMGTTLKLEINDGTRLKEDWIEKFGLVMCDVPCSGLGLVNSKPDIILNRTESDIAQLAKIQFEIILNASKYVIKGGILCYSTCTVMQKENGEIISKFLSLAPDFELLPINNGIVNSKTALQLLPQIHDCDGFFVARMRKKL